MPSKGCGVCSRMAAFAVVYVGRTLICTSHLYRCVRNFLPTALWTGLLRFALSLYVVTVDSLHIRLKLLSKQGWKVGWLRLRNNRFGPSIYVENWSATLPVLLNFCTDLYFRIRNTRNVKYSLRCLSLLAASFHSHYKTLKTQRPSL